MCAELIPSVQFWHICRFLLFLYSAVVHSHMLGLCMHTINYYPYYSQTIRMCVSVLVCFSFRADDLTLCVVEYDSIVFSPIMNTSRQCVSAFKCLLLFVVVVVVVVVDVLLFIIISLAVSCYCSISII